jgi:hypothetical protein
VTKKATLRLSDEDKEKVILFTITSSESDIRMCMLINQVFKINMSLSDDLIIKFATETIGFRKYQFEEEIEEEKFTLLVNRHFSGKYLFPEYKKIDYIFVISSELNANHFERQIKALKDLSGVSAIFKIDPSTVKSFKRIVI